MRVEEEINYPDKLYYSIGEVARLLDVNPSLIRFWEKEFSSIKPRKNRRGNRIFTVKDIEEVKKVYDLVKEQGHTLEGAKRILKNRKGKDKTDQIKEKLKAIRGFLVELKSDIQ